MVSSYQAKMQTPSREAYPHTGEFMSKSYVPVTPETDIYQAMKLLLKHQINALPVVDAENNLVGIVSEKDCLKLAAHDAYQNDLPGGPVRTFMTKDVVSVTPETGLGEVIELFMTHPYKKLPVVNHGKLVGVVRRRDVLVVLQEFHQKRMAFLGEG